MAIPTVNTSTMRWELAKKTLTAMASDLGLAPGDFPKSLDVVSHRTQDARRFTRIRILATGGDVDTVLYRCDEMALVIFND